MKKANYQAHEKKIYNIIKFVFKQFYIEALGQMHKNYSAMMDNPESKKAIEEKFAIMRDMYKNPKKYFSRGATSDAWDARAKEYVREKNSPIVKGFGAHELVDAPAKIATDMVADCMPDMRLRKRFAEFCELVQKWDYARTAHKPESAKTVEALVTEIKNIAKLFILASRVDIMAKRKTRMMTEKVM